MAIITAKLFSVVPVEREENIMVMCYFELLMFAVRW